MQFLPKIGGTVASIWIENGENGNTHVKGLIVCYNVINITLNIWDKTLFMKLKEWTRKIILKMPIKFWQNFIKSKIFKNPSDSTDVKKQKIV